MSAKRLPADKTLAMDEVWRRSLDAEERIKSLEKKLNITGNLSSILDNLSKSIKSSSGYSGTIDPSTISHNALSDVNGGTLHVTASDKSYWNAAYIFRQAAYSSTGFMAFDGAGTMYSVFDSSANWNTAYSWGNHAGLYRPISYVPAWSEITSKPTTLTGYGITDAMSTSHPANAITATDISHWNTAYGWGDHAGLYRPISYVPAWSEITSKPTTLSGFGITDSCPLSHKTTEDALNGLVKCNGAGSYSAVTDKSSNWNTAYGWGNHASAGYAADSAVLKKDGSVALTADWNAGSHKISCDLINIATATVPTDLNVYEDALSVRRTSNTSANRPSDYYTVLTIGATNNSDFQLASYYGSSNQLYFRGRHDTDGVWHSWTKILLEESYVPAWASISGKPTTLAGYGITDGALDSAVLKKDGSVALTADWNTGTGRTVTVPYVLAAQTMRSTTGSEIVEAITTGLDYRLKIQSEAAGVAFYNTSGAMKGYLKYSPSDSRGMVLHYEDWITIEDSAGVNHAARWESAYGWGNWASNFGAVAGKICQGNDSRLSDARTPLSHSHAWTDITTGAKVEIYDPASSGSVTSLLLNRAGAAANDQQAIKWKSSTLEAASISSEVLSSTDANLIIKTNTGGTTNLAEAVCITHDKTLLWGNAREGVLSWDTDKAIVGAASSKDLVFSAGGTQYIKLTTTGNIKIGDLATTPAEKLHVIGNGIFDAGSDTRVYLRNSATNIGQLQVTSSSLRLHALSTNTWEAWTNGVKRFSISSTGFAEFFYGLRTDTLTVTGATTIQGLLTASASVSVTGDITATGKVAGAKLVIPVTGSTAPSSPINGEVWLDNVDGWIHVYVTGLGWCHFEPTTVGSW